MSLLKNLVYLLEKRLKKVFSLSSIDKLIDIQVNLDDLASLLKNHEAFHKPRRLYYMGQGYHKLH